MVVLDTSLLVALDRSDARAQDLLRRWEADDEPLTVPAAVWTEYLVGVAPRLRERAAGLLARAAEVVAFDRDVADRAVRLQSDLLDAGRRLGWHDLQVAATALHRHEPLATLDDGFDDLDGLDVLRP